MCSLCSSALPSISRGRHVFKVIIVITMLGLHGRSYTFDTYPRYFATAEECESVLHDPVFQQASADLSQRVAARGRSNVVSYKCVPTGLKGPPLDGNGNEVPRKPDKGIISTPDDRG